MTMYFLNNVLQYSKHCYKIQCVFISKTLCYSFILNMIIVKTKVLPSVINNLGLFADEDIEIGTVIWNYHPSTCIVIQPEQMQVLSQSYPDNFISSINHFGCPYNDGCLVHLDNMRYINHSETPNTISLDNDTMIASRKIYCGEELFENYRQYSNKNYCVNFLSNML